MARISCCSRARNGEQQKARATSLRTPPTSTPTKHIFKGSNFELATNFGTRLSVLPVTKPRPTRGLSQAQLPHMSILQQASGHLGYTNSKKKSKPKHSTDPKSRNAGLRTKRAECKQHPVNSSPRGHLCTCVAGPCGRHNWSQHDPVHVLAVLILHKRHFWTCHLPLWGQPPSPSFETKWEEQLILLFSRNPGPPSCSHVNFMKLGIYYPPRRRVAGHMSASTWILILCLCCYLRFPEQGGSFTFFLLFCGTGDWIQGCSTSQWHAWPFLYFYSFIYLFSK